MMYFVLTTFLILILALSFWIGVYVVVPLILIGVLLSAIGSLVRFFMPEDKNLHTKSYFIKNEKSKENQIIDVEYEEIK